MHVLGWRIPFIDKISDLFWDTLVSRASANFPADWLKNYYEFGGGFDTNAAGVSVNESTALKHSAYWRAVNLLSSQIASFPIGLFKRLPNGNTEEITDHAAVRLLTRKPNGITTPFIWKETTQANVLTKGNAYSYIDRDRQGNPVSLSILEPGNMVPKTDGKKLVYEYLQDVYDPYYILHIPGLSFDGIKGQSVLQVAAESMGVGLAMQKYSAGFYKNGAKQSGFLLHPLSLGEKAITGLKKSFKEKLLGPEGGTGVLDEGMKYQPNSTPPIDQQLLQLKQFSVQEIARWFGVPVHLLMEESRSTFNNIAEQGISFVRYTLTQWVERWEAELESKLLTEVEKDDHFFKFNMNSLMRGNPTDRGEFIAQMIQNGVFSINDARKLEDLNSIDGGDKHYVQVNMQPIDAPPKEQNNE